MNRGLVIALCALGALACNRGGNQVVIPDLDRPGKLDLFCADIEDIIQDVSFDVRRLLPLEACDFETEQIPEDFDPNSFGAVTQVQRGEVAAISFTERFVVNTNQTVPGVTGFVVDEQPTGVKVSPADPSFTYVSSFSAKTVQAYATQLILGVNDDSLPLPQRVSFDAGPTDLALYESVTTPPDVPTDEDNIVIPDQITFGEIAYRFLFAPVPDLGVVYQVEWDLESNTWVSPTAIPLATEDCDTISPVEADPEAPNYERVCPSVREVKIVNTTLTCTPPPVDGPRPVAVHVDDGGTPDDASDDYLLVADSNLPIIHRLALGPNGAAGSTDEPIAVGTPTSSVVSTPFVPATFDNTEATQRYLYAVSSTDDSVLAVEYTESADTFGAVLPVLAGVGPRANEEGVESRNRVRSFFTNARAIEVLTPNYELEEQDDGGLIVPDSILCDATNTDEVLTAQNPANMRGVFLAVSLSQGFLFFLDIYDLNGRCRGGDNGDCNSTTEGDAFASIQRHRRRFAASPSELIEIQGTPALVFNASQGTLDPETGEGRNSDGPALEFVSCPDSMGSVFGDNPGGELDGLICSSTQVWSTLTQRWDGTYEGLIPNTQGGLGKFEPESVEGRPSSADGVSWFSAGDVPLCQVGVLGPGVSLPGYPDPLISPQFFNSDYEGDRLFITGELPVATENDMFCDQLFGDVPDEIDDLPVWFPIVQAFDNEVEIGPSPNPGRYSFEDVLTCYPQFTDYEVHTRGVYTVVGTSTGFVHRVTASEEDGACVLDDTRPVDCLVQENGECPEEDPVLDVDTVLTGRAFPQVQYVNPLVSFEIGPFSEDAQPTDSTQAVLTFSIFNAFTVLTIGTDGGLRSLPSSMTYSPLLEDLFFVDLQSGVRQLTFSPLSTVETFQ